MDADIKIFINGIKEKTGIELAVFTLSGKYVGGVIAENETVPAGLDHTVIDTQRNRTLFVMSVRQKKYIGRIMGVGVAEKNYAYLINELAENFFSKEIEYTRSEFYKAILAGEMNYSQFRRYAVKFSIPEIPCFAMIITAEKCDVSDVVNVLLGYGNDEQDFAVTMESDRCAFIKFSDEVSDEYQSSTEYAEFLKQSIYEEIGVSVKICVGGTVKSVYDLSTSYTQALTALRMSRALNTKGDVHSYKEYILIKMLEELPKSRLNDCLEILMDSGAKEIFADEEMINTAEEFLESSLNLSETSRKLYLHRNTLMYRLDKIEKATGLNIRKFSDALTFRLITILAKLIK